ncbi:hypothetical protein FAM18108_03061 [Lacticaseibacillus paracasei]|nr:hypothetical protein FAM18108_03061 [Lacticaseibacillus paracasei]
MTKSSKEVEKIEQLLAEQDQAHQETTDTF